MTLIDHLTNAELRLEQLRYQVKEQIQKITELQGQRHQCRHKFNDRNNCELCGINRDYAVYQRIGVVE